ncbi:metal-dependent transcriptional regulator [Tenacibaculum sp. 1_MG-2023]|uniref:metal-dependent transcriptional regulator n=1 Tax=Tenacibaculum sp. 1_MG-2023 TaxID=3062653 RepID=UPI0026E12CD1|nr:metal-dependent transcriptional regulator [Tenacibaculum sp. 1_MG-2023]MDO6675276.1 metal-dependent transcriptional regulator [Tenacibaculum sp. 1_MG-2023]
MDSLVEENYLKALFYLSNEKREVSVNELSKQLDIKMPTVTSMMKKLAGKKLVSYEKYKPIRLTVLGQNKAVAVIRKHRLTEMFLVEVMSFGWEEVHDIAEQIEHVDSPIFFKKMDEILGYPSFDPHGSPIPDVNGKIPAKTYYKLSEYKGGDVVRLKAVANSSADFLRFLNSKGLSLETIIEVLLVESFDGTMTLAYKDKKEEVLSKVVCDRLLVEKN